MKNFKVLFLNIRKVHKECFACLIIEKFAEQVFDCFYVRAANQQILRTGWTEKENFGGRNNDREKAIIKG